MTEYLLKFTIFDRNISRNTPAIYTDSPLGYVDHNLPRYFLVIYTDSRSEYIDRSLPR